MIFKVLAFVPAHGADWVNRPFKRESLFSYQNSLQTFTANRFFLVNHTFLAKYIYVKVGNFDNTFEKGLILDELQIKVSNNQNILFVSHILNGNAK